VQEGWVNI